MQKGTTILAIFIMVGMFAAAGTKYYLESHTPQEDIFFYGVEKTIGTQVLTQKMRVASVAPWEHITHADGSTSTERTVSVIDATGQRRFAGWYAEEFEGELKVGDIVSASMGVFVDYDNLKLDVKWTRINFKIIAEEVK